RQDAARAAGIDERRKLLLHEADEHPHADGDRHERRRRDPRLDRVVRPDLPEGEPRRRTEPADPEALDQVRVQARRRVEKQVASAAYTHAVKPLAVTLGDPAGVGAEVVEKALSEIEVPVRIFGAVPGPIRYGELSAEYG